ncbi:MAG TPA: stressosome-associated protein Prli42 [Candidatus Dormibacteraeota bacterium]|nr:stressosome-associated protein Prli42 [Candidatus Dormibacteraeota bacterium]
MTNKKKNEEKPRKLSKRARRNRLIIYIMIIAMILSSLTAGLAYIL